MEAVADHELEIGKERLSVGIFMIVQLVSHRREVHGPLDDLGVGWNVQG